MEVYIHLFLAFTLEGHERSATLAMMNEAKDKPHRRFDERGAQNKNPISCLTMNLGLPARSQNILGSWGHFFYPLLTV